MQVYVTGHALRSICVYVSLPRRWHRSKEEHNNVCLENMQ